MATSRVTTEAGSYRVCAVASENPEARHWTITVSEYAGTSGGWLVRWGALALSAGGGWDIVPRNSDLTQDWVDAHTFTRDDALQRAEREATRIEVNGYDAAAANEFHRTHRR